jgi:hypothetical protein
MPLNSTEELDDDRGAALAGLLLLFAVILEKSLYDVRESSLRSFPTDARSAALAKEIVVRA